MDRGAYWATGHGVQGDTTEHSATTNTLYKCCDRSNMCHLLLQRREREGREKGRKGGREEGTKEKSEVRSKQISLWQRRKLPSILLGSSDWRKN